MVGLPPAVNQGVQQLALEAYVRPLMDDLVRSRAAYEASASLYWEAESRGEDGRRSGQVPWAP